MRWRMPSSKTRSPGGCKPCRVIPGPAEAGARNPWRCLRTATTRVWIPDSRFAASGMTTESDVIRTVTGDIETVRGRVLAHEHLQIDLSAQKGPANKVGEEEIPAVVEDLRTAKEYGLAAITDLSAPLWGRAPAALRRISKQSGV